MQCLRLKSKMRRGTREFWPMKLAALLALGLSYYGALADTSITYQGRLSSGGNFLNGNYDFTFSLYDASTSGTQIGATLTNNSVLVTNGLFTITMDFGSQAFNGDSRWLEIGVRNGTNTFAVLNPRQAIGRAPYAISALNVTGQTAFTGTFTGDGSGLTNLNLTAVTAATNDLNTALSSKINSATNDLNTTVSARISSATNDLNSALSSRITAATNDLNTTLSSKINAATNDLNSTLSTSIVAATNAPWIASTNWVISQGYQSTNGLIRKPIVFAIPTMGTNYITDFNSPVVQLVATNNINFLQSTNRTASGWYAEAVWYIQGGSTNFTVKFNTNWTKVGTLATNNPALIASNKLTIVAFSTRGPSETNVAYAIARQE